MEERLRQFFADQGISPSSETGRSFIFNCPACGGTQKLYMQKSDGSSVCFKQGTSTCPKNRSKPQFVLAQLTSLPVKEIADIIYLRTAKLEQDTLKIDFSDRKITNKNQELALATLEMHFVPLLDNSAKPGVDYLASRGISFEIAQKYGIMYSAVFKRVIFPVIMKNTLYGWQARAIEKNVELRMKNMPGYWKSQSLMFYDNIINKDFAILAEGPVDALKFEKVGGFVASMGKTISTAQLKLLKDAKIKRLYLALDDDADDKLDAIKKYLDDGVTNRMQFFKLKVPSHREDFGACTYEECEEAFRNAKSMEDSMIILPLGVFR
jgi:hypothetical protein